MKEKLYNILEKFVINNNVKINPKDFKLQLLSNPSYPSVKAISDTLDYFGIDNVVANVPKDALEQLPQCFLAVLEIDSSKTITQVVRKKDRIKLLKDDGSKEKLSIKDFKASWNGTIIAVEKSTEEIKKQQVYFKNPLIPLSLLGIIAITFSLINLELQAMLYTILALVGCGIAYFIVRESLGLHNEVTSKICNSASSNTSCSEVINSKNKLLGLVSLSDATITFFMATVLIISLFNYNPSFFLGLSLLSIPIIFYSLYSQAFIIKKWCPLCLAVVGVLVAQLIITLVFISIIEFNAIYLIKSVVLTIAFYLSWIYAKGISIKAIKQEQLQTDFLKFKRNENLFTTLLTKKILPSKDKIEPDFQISFGNPDAKLKITSVTNPMCGFCTKAFEAYDTLLKTHGSKFELSIVFSVPTSSLENQGTQISQRIIDFYKDNPSKAYASLKDWFVNRDVDSWQSKYGIPSKDTSLHTLELHKTWCDLNEINYTPATIIGNYFFPQEYQIKDLSLFIDYLAEYKNNVISSVVTERPKILGEVKAKNISV